MNTSKEIKILTAQGAERTTIGVNEGALGHFSLGSEDYIILPFNSPTAVPFRIGDYVDLTNVLNDVGLGGKFNKVYEVVTIPSPTYDLDTDSLHYDLRLDAYYYKWQNKLFKYIPVDAGSELSWTLTATLDVHLAILTRNLTQLGYTFNGEAFEGVVQDDYSTEAKTITYDNVNLIDALNQMAEEWECEWWVVENYIHMGRYEHSDAVDVEINVQASAMTKSESTGDYATRLFVFGADKNLPKNYRPAGGDVTINGVVQKRLMTPDGTLYIDAYRYDGEGNKVYIGETGYDSATEMPASEAVEGVIVNEDIYPRTEQEVTYITTYTDKVLDEDGNETGEIQTFYLIGYDTSKFKFTDDMILSGKTLEVVFTSGLLNGMTFEVTFRQAGYYVGATPLPQDCFEIVSSDTYTTTLPNDYLHPQVSNTFILTGWDSTKIESLGLITLAEEELLAYGKEYITKTMVDDGTYTTTLMSHWVFADIAHRLFDAGQRINLINRAYFDGGRKSRVLGYEIKLDLPYDSPQYTIGESVEYKRIDALESKVDSIIYGGNTYTSTSGGAGVYLITLNDKTAPSITNAYSALRTRYEFLLKTENDTTTHHLSIGGATINSEAGTEDDFDWTCDGFVEVTPYIQALIEAGYGLLTEDGYEIITESGDILIEEN